ncbi:hypothetical protein CDL12_28862 [Handroanthus impetiginosus]|uniref:Uncharacterized protein n=1 Tax=Handroanthus impetiginosus TaxID=429701 RepID=A0A2G9G006_9LAMI|nr:hypothetical protein CDL12_28862 [Handroanthus impetiginosus]
MLIFCRNSLPLILTVILFTVIQLLFMGVFPCINSAASFLTIVLFTKLLFVGGSWCLLHRDLLVYSYVPYYC